MCRTSDNGAGLEEDKAHHKVKVLVRVFYQDTFILFPLYTLYTKENKEIKLLTAWRLCLIFQADFISKAFRNNYTACLERFDI